MAIHEGDPLQLLGLVADGSLDLALVDDVVTHADSKRLLDALLPKLRPGGHAIVRNYTLWSVLSGVPYGVPAAVHELAKQGLAGIAGFILSPRGYHQVLLRRKVADSAEDTGGEARSPLSSRRSTRSPLLAALPMPESIGRPAAPRPDVGGLLGHRLPTGASVLVAGDPDARPLAIDVHRSERFCLDEPAPTADPIADSGSVVAARLESLAREGWTHLLIPAESFGALDRNPALSLVLRRRHRLVHLDSDSAIVSLHEPSAWAELDSYADAFRTSEGRDPAILDWDTGLNLAQALPDLPVFSPEMPETARLPYVDGSVDLVAIRSGDPGRLQEALRIAGAAVVEIGGTADAGQPALRLELIRKSRGEEEPTSTAATVTAVRATRSLEGRRLLVCSHHLPQPECDSYSRRLFHLVGFLRDEGCEVTCVASNAAGHDAYARLLTDRGATVRIGLDASRIAALARESRFDWALFGFWNTAHPLVPLLRRVAPETRLIVDSGDLHFLRNSRRILRDGDGSTGRLDADFAIATAREIDTYGAADAVLAVSRK